MVWEESLGVINDWLTDIDGRADPEAPLDLSEELARVRIRLNIEVMLNITCPGDTTCYIIHCVWSTRLLERALRRRGTSRTCNAFPDGGDNCALSPYHESLDAGYRLRPIDAPTRPFPFTYAEGDEDFVRSPPHTHG